MKRTRALACAALLGVAVATGCSGGSKSVPDTTGTVKFSITVPLPSSSSAARKPNFDAPSGTQSVSISLTSVNGTAQTGQATVANLSGGSNGCTTSGSQLTCSVSVTAPAGNDLFSVASYAQPNAQGTQLGKGTVSVQAVQGQTTNAPVSLNGTVAGIALSLGVPPVTGVAATIPLVIVAKDSSGATIMGTYSNPIALTDSDTTGATKLSATSIADSTAAAAVSITYTGASLSSAAQISATASNVASSAITNVSFNPNNDYAVQDGATFTYNMTGTDQFMPASPPPGPTPTPSTFTTTMTAAFHTGASFNGQSNLIDVHENANNLWFGVGSDTDFYYNAASSKTGANVYEVAWTNKWVDAQGQTQTYAATATSPGWQIAQVPFASGNTWKAGADYVDNESYPNYDSNGNVDGSYSFKYAEKADGSYAENDEWISTGSSDDTDAIQQNADGSSTETDTQKNLSDGSVYQYVYTTGTPEPAPTGTPGMVIKYTELDTQVNPQPSASPTPQVTYYPDWFPGGNPPSPLQTDVTTDKGSVTIPAQCSIDTSIATTAEDLNEQYSDVDAWGDVYKTTYDYYYTPGVGLVCGVMDGVDQYYDTSTAALHDTWHWTEVQSLTSTTLQTALRKTNSMSAAATFATAGLQAQLQQAQQVHASRIRALHAKHRMQMLRAKHNR
jgi:hypothetical protein